MRRGWYEVLITKPIEEKLSWNYNLQFSRGRSHLTRFSLGRRLRRLRILQVCRSGSANGSAELPTVDLILRSLARIMTLQGPSGYSWAMMTRQHKGAPCCAIQACYVLAE